MTKFFEFLEKNEVLSCVHGEHIKFNDDPFEREKKFLDIELHWIRKTFLILKLH